MTKQHRKWFYGGLIILGGIVVIIWMKNYLVNKGVINASSPAIGDDPLGIGKLKLDPIFATTTNAQPGTTAAPSVLQ